jgi:SAM-dependent methyltransferase
MSSRNRLFRAFYRLGFIPWDGHPLAASLTSLVESLPPGRALDIGCGTGDNCIYLSQHGWQVTGIDYVATAVDRARLKVAAAGVDVTLKHADATRLRAGDVGAGFDLIVDNGCLHGMSDQDRDAYVREVTAVAATGARLLLVEFVPGASFGVPGIAPADVERRFSAHWKLTSSGDEAAMNHNGKNPARYYLFDRAGG